MPHERKNLSEQPGGREYFYFHFLRSLHCQAAGLPGSRGFRSFSVTGKRHTKPMALDPTWYASLPMLSSTPVPTWSASCDSPPYLSPVSGVTGSPLQWLGDKAQHRGQSRGQSTGDKAQQRGQRRGESRKGVRSGMRGTDRHRADVRCVLPLKPSNRPNLPKYHSLVRAYLRLCSRCGGLGDKPHTM